jgi:hypothetical protein
MKVLLPGDEQRDTKQRKSQSLLCGITFEHLETNN